MELNIKKNAPSLPIAYILLCTLYFVLNISPSFSQAPQTSGIQKSKISTTVGGVKFFLHTVEKGQTLFAISKAYEISLNDIVIENPEAIDGIKPGQVLKVPVKKPKKIEPALVTEDANYKIHKVEAGQTLYSIAKQYETSVEKLKIANPELRDGLKGGQLLKIPKIKKTVTKTTDKAVTKTADKTTDKTAVKAADKITAKTKISIKEPSISSTDTSLVMGPLDSLTAFILDTKRNSPDSITTPAIIYSGEIKKEYNVAFFLPFHAKEANEIETEQIIKGEEQLPNKSVIALQFYEGALLAIDSLKKQKLNAKIFVYDIDDRDSLNMEKLLKKPELAEMDLMIGPLYGSSFMPIAKFAKEHTIPIVSPFTQMNKILFNNPYVCKVQPSSIMQVEQMAYFVIDTFQKQNIILVNNGNPKEVSFFNVFKKTAIKALSKAQLKTVDSLKEVKSVEAIAGMLNPAKINVIVLPSNNQSYITEFISKLNSLNGKNKIVLMGLQSWINFDNLDFDYLNNLSVHIPSNNYIDYQNATTQSFIKSYREKFKTDPELYSYQGYDIAFYFISTLQKNGGAFLNNLVNTKYQGIETKFDFMQYPAGSGFENKFVYILKYADYKLVKAN